MNYFKMGLLFSPTQVGHHMGGADSELVSPARMCCRCTFAAP